MDKKNKPMPVGVEDFKKLREGYYFIDKTAFIGKFLDTHTDVTLITRPRRFGKTLTLSMLKYFFSADNAKENRKLFAGLDIEKAGNTYMDEQGTRPVISLTLKDVGMQKFSDTIKFLARTMQNLYSEHRYLLAGEVLDEGQRDYFRLIQLCQGTTADLAISLKNLMIYLTEHWHRPPILLLDEYDAPIIDAWGHNYYTECIDFMRTFLTAALKTNNYLDFAVLTGITRVSKESIFSGLNNLEVCSVLSAMYADALGFTQDEVTEMMSDRNVADKLPELKKWYDGYLFGKTEIYNPWSVINFIRGGCEFKAYWINVSGNAILKDLLNHIDEERQKELLSLLQGGTVETPVQENTVYADLTGNRDALYMMLLTTGYLKAINIHKVDDDVRVAELKIPNKEIKHAYKSEIYGYIVPSRSRLLLQNMLKAMINGNAKEFADKLAATLKDYVSFHDTAHNPECFYHGLMLGLSVLLANEYRLESNREAGYGRFDLALCPHDHNYAGVIMEFKTANNTDELKNLAGIALAQIKQKEYAQALTVQGVKQIWAYGIAFCGKQIFVVSE